MTIIPALCLIACLPFARLSAHRPYYSGAKIIIAAHDADTTYNTAGLFEPGTQPQLISRQFGFTEGPAADNAGNIYFTDQPNNTIWKYSLTGELEVFTGDSGRSNGMYFDKHGNLLTCADQDNQIWKYNRRGMPITVLFAAAGGRKFNGPNDLWIDAKGGIYFTDPYYQRPYWARTQPDLEGEKVYYLPAGKKQAIAVSDNLQKPNGIAGTRDGKYLYVADIKANKTYRFQIQADGSLTGQQAVIQKGSDGMTLDDQGNVYLTSSKGVYIYNAEGNQIGLIAIPEPWTANVCFGGKDSKTLFITASKTIYTFKMKVSGYTKNASKQL
jgi:gluconolactonase